MTTTPAQRIQLRRERTARKARAQYLQQWLTSLGVPCRTTRWYHRIDITLDDAERLAEALESSRSCPRTKEV